MQNKQLKADIALLFVTLVWGSTFVLIQKALADIPPYTFIALRFLLAFAILSAVFWRHYKSLNPRIIGFSFLIAISMFAGYALQTIGLQYTTASKSGFITGLCVVLVPLISAVLTKKPPKLQALLGVSLATVGLALMTLDSQLSINLGDQLTFAGAVSFAAFIILVDRFTSKVDSILLAILQIGMVAVFSLIFSLVFEVGAFQSLKLTPDVIIGLLVTGVLATALAFLVQNLVQNFTSPTHTALIFTAEPVFSAIFAYIILGELMSPKGIWGGILIFGGMLVAEVRFRDLLAFLRFKKIDGETVKNPSQF